MKHTDNTFALLIGSLHCSTWDVRRNGKKKNYFENRDSIEDTGLLNLTDLP